LRHAILLAPRILRSLLDFLVNLWTHTLGLF